MYAKISWQLPLFKFIANTLEVIIVVYWWIKWNSVVFYYHCGFHFSIVLASDFFCTSIWIQRFFRKIRVKSGFIREIRASGTGPGERASLIYVIKIQNLLACLVFFINTIITIMVIFDDLAVSVYIKLHIFISVSIKSFFFCIPILLRNTCVSCILIVWTCENPPLHWLNVSTSPTKWMIKKTIRQTNIKSKQRPNSIHYVFIDWKLKYCFWFFIATFIKNHIFN